MAYQPDKISNDMLANDKQLDHADKPSKCAVTNVLAPNLLVPGAREACIHGLIKSVVIKHLSAAILFPGGDSTYKQLNLSSRRLIYYLIYLGLNRDIIRVVVLRFERSILASTAALAARRADGTCVPFDITQLEDEIRTIVAQLSAPVVC